MRSIVRSAKMKVFRFAKPGDSLVPVDAANELLEEMRIDGPTGLTNLSGKQIILRIAQNLNR